MYSPNEGGRTARILVVDDIAPNVELLEALLTAAGYMVDTAFDGTEALQRADENPPDLVILDVMMPGMNGFEVAQRLKADPRQRFTPILLLTALDQTKDKVEGLEAGADDFLSKPFNRAELMARVRSLLRIKSLHDEVEQKNHVLDTLLRRYVSEEIVADLHANPDILRHRYERVVTVLFADIRGFTRFCECSTPDVAVDTLNQIFERITPVIFEAKGTLDKYVGDQVMAFFGAPISMGNDIKRAVTAALGMRDAFDQLYRTWTDPALKELGLGIGLNTGQVIVGNVGTAKLMDYTVIGDNVNLAARLEQAATKSQIIISEATYAAAKDIVIAHQLPPFLVRGKREPITAYELDGLAP